MPEPFRNLVSPARLKKLGGRIHCVHPGFDTEGFLADSTRGLRDMELKDRIRHVAAALKAHLPADYPKALGILVRMLEETPALRDEEFILWPVCHFVETYGLEHFDESMRAMPRITQHFTCEFTIRPYLLADSRRALRHVRAWLKHDSERVRRLVSEGTRPRLPWGRRLAMFQADPAPVIRLLDKLYRDDSELVRRSVANNINDISKDHPDIAIDTIRRWQDKPGPRFERLRHHALRTLSKQGHRDALALLGFAPAEKLSATLSIGRKRMRLGESLPFSLELHNWHNSDQALMIDYALHFRKAAGGLSPKVFKWTQRTLGKGERLVIERAHLLKAVTVRRYYAGEQMLEVMVNGQRVARASFTLSL